MTRVAVALAVVIALAAGVWMLWPDGERTPSTTTTLPIAASSSTTSTPAGTTTTADDHIVDTVEEAEAILRELWFGWYSAFYNQDEDALRDVAIQESEIEAAISRFGEQTFSKAPTPNGLAFADTEILHSDEACLAVWTAMTPGFLTVAGTTSGVNVLRWVGTRWKSYSYWMYRGDLWNEDCGVLLQ